LYLLDLDLKEEDTLNWTTDPNLYSQVSESNQCSSIQIAESDVSDLFSLNRIPFSSRV